MLRWPEFSRDTLFGVTYMVMSPEHPLIDKYKEDIKNWDEIAAYREQAARKSDFERAELAKEKTGVKIDGLTAVNPVSDVEIPIFVSDYVLMSYGTGAIMAVPAHDERDWDFAKKFGLPIIEVVAGGRNVQEEVYTDVATGTIVNSGFISGLSVENAQARMIDFLEEKGIGCAKTNFKLRDWVFSRQRYWGEPIPIVHCEKCGYVPIDESELPLELPEVDSYTYGVMCTNAGTKPVAVTLSAENIFDEILKANNELDNAEVPETGRVLVVTPDVYTMMKRSKDIIMETDIAEDMRLKGVISIIDGAVVVKVPAVRLPEDFGFMLSHPCACVAPTKLEDYKVHEDPPGISGSLVEGRICYDAFVLDNKVKAIYYQAQQTAMAKAASKV